MCLERLRLGVLANYWERATIEDVGVSAGKAVGFFVFKLIEFMLVTEVCQGVYV